MRPRLAPLALAALMLGCGHTDPFTGTDAEPRGPFSTANHMQLTFNAGADLAPAWTDDGTGILYTYSEPTRPDHDRCLGILPGGGGSRTLSLCDERPGHADSAETLTSAALSSDGRLLYLVGASTRITPIPSNVTLFLADAAAPLARRAVVTLPLQLGAGLAPNWLANVTWIDETTFLALAQDFTLVPSCNGCAARDTVYNNLGIVRGTIPASGEATVQLVPGTEGITAFTLADGKTQLLYAQGRTVWKAPAVGGEAAVVATLPAGDSRRIDDISCRGTTCVLIVFEFTTKSTWRLERMASSGGTTTLLESTDAGPWLAAKVSPTGPDVVVRVGSFKTGDLYLFRNLLP